MCIFGRSRKAEMLSRTRRYKNCYNLSSLQFFDLKLGRVLCNSYSNLWFLHFSHCWNRRSKLSKLKNSQSTLVSGCFFSPKEVEKLFDFDFRKLHNVTDVFVPICVSILHGFPSRAFLKQRLASERKPYQRSSIRQQPRIYRGPVVNVLKKIECNNYLPSVVIEIGYSRRYWPAITKIWVIPCLIWNCM